MDLYINSIYWQQKSEELLTDYKVGWNLGKFGDNSKITTEKFLTRFESVFEESIKNLYRKEGKTVEKITLHFKILESIIFLLSNEVDKQQLKHMNPESIVAFMHGFVDSYIQNVIKRGDVDDELL